MRRSLLILATAAMTALGGCDGGAREPEPLVTADHERLSKIAAYDNIVQRFVIEDVRRDYEAQNIASAGADDRISIRTGSLEAGLLDLRRAREMPGSAAAIDAAADKVLPPLQRLLDRSRGPDSYFTTRGQLTDGFARARREDPLMRADFAATLAVYAPFAAAVEKARDADRQAMLPRLKADGQLTEYYDILILRKARDLAREMTPEGAAGDPARLAKADAIVSELLALLDRRRAAQKQGGDEYAGTDNGVVLTAEQMIGAYREYRRTKKADDQNQMIELHRNVATSLN